MRDTVYLIELYGQYLLQTKSRGRFYVSDPLTALRCVTISAANKFARQENTIMKMVFEHRGADKENGNLIDQRILSLTRVI